MKKNTLFLLIALQSSLLNAQNPDIRLIGFDLATNDRLTVFIHPSAPDTLNNVYSFNQTFANYGASYLAVNDFDTSYQETLAAYPLAWMFCAYPIDFTGFKVLDGYIHAESHQDSALYPMQWLLNLQDGLDAYYRKNISDQWIYLNDISDSLLVNPNYLGAVFDPASDTIDANGDGYIFSFQFKIEIQSDEINTIPSLPTKEDITFLTGIDKFVFTLPPNKYTLALYDLSGRLIYSNRYNSNTIEINRNDLPKGLYIYTLQSDIKAYSGKFLNN